MQERLKYESRQSKIAKLVDMFEVSERESCSAISTTG